MKKRIAVFTGTRAEYGLLAPILRLIEQHEDLELLLLVSGTHLSHMHGYTISQILEDGFKPDAAFASILATDSAQAVRKSFALTVLDVGAELERADVDVIVVLGDRFEALAVAVAAVIQGVPVAHLHGGEISEGASDERYRHAITKLADLHFVAGREFGERVRQMGEVSRHVFECGPAVQDVLSTMASMSRDALSEILGFSLQRTNALVVYHPATASAENPRRAMDNIIAGALQSGVDQLIVSAPNADQQFRQISDVIHHWSEKDERVVSFGNVGQVSYLSLLRECTVIVGNSSSGIIEAPLLGTPTVNVGHRQDGRPRAKSVIDVEPEASVVSLAIQGARRTVVDVAGGSPYSLGVSMAERVVNVMVATDLKSLSGGKEFVSISLSGSLSSPNLKDEV